MLEWRHVVVIVTKRCKLSVYDQHEHAHLFAVLSEGPLQ